MDGLPILTYPRDAKQAKKCLNGGKTVWRASLMNQTNIPSLTGPLLYVETWHLDWLKGVSMSYDDIARLWDTPKRIEAMLHSSEHW